CKASSQLPWPQCVKFDERSDTCNSSETLLIVRIGADLLLTMWADALPLYRSLTDSESYAAASAERPGSPPTCCGRRALEPGPATKHPRCYAQESRDVD